jgi:hypothetical protein
MLCGPLLQEASDSLLTNKKAKHFNITNYSIKSEFHNYTSIISFCSAPSVLFLYAE